MAARGSARQLWLCLPCGCVALSRPERLCFFFAAPKLQALQAPKVALLFLTRGDLFHHGVWQQWFEAGERAGRGAGTHAACAAVVSCAMRSAEAIQASLFVPAARDLLPAEQLRAAACPAATAATPAPEPGSEGEQGDEQAAARQVQLAPRVIAEACGWNASAGQPLRAGSGGGAAGGSAIDQQHLFSVYIHAPPDVTGKPRAFQRGLFWAGMCCRCDFSAAHCLMRVLLFFRPADDQLPKVFRGRLISDRLQPEWGTHQVSTGKAGQLPPGLERALPSAHLACPCPACSWWRRPATCCGRLFRTH